MPKRRVSVRDVSALKGCLLAIKGCVDLKGFFYRGVYSRELSTWQSFSNPVQVKVHDSAQGGVDLKFHLREMCTYTVDM